MHFDVASWIQLVVRPKIPQDRAGRAGIRLIFISPKSVILRYYISLLKPWTNNETKYEVLYSKLELAIKMGIPSLHIYGDS